MRDLFLLDPGIVFLNHGSFGACPREVFEDFQRWQLELEHNPVAFLGRRSGALLRDARERLAACVGARADDLVFVPNATTGVNIVARSFPLQPGDEVLGTDLEYGACDVTWTRECARRGASYRRVPIPLPFDRATFADRMLDAAGARTRLIFASHLTSATAIVLPVAELCAKARARGIATLIDGAHAPGQLALDLDTLGADYYTGNAHKWLCAPKGAAFLHVRSEHHARLEEPVTSWGRVAEALGLDAFDAYTGRTTIERRLQWQGTRDLAAFLAVPAAIAFQARHDWDAVRARCHAAVVRARRRLCERFGLEPPCGEDEFAQMAAIPVPHRDADALRRRLYDDSGIEIAVTRHADRVYLRLSVQGYNTDADLQALLAAPALDPAWAA